jgi:hypothetical protein
VEHTAVADVLTNEINFAAKAVEGAWWHVHIIGTSGRGVTRSASEVRCGAA